jgi:hypothetical protein
MTPPDTNTVDDYALTGELIVKLESLNYDIGFADHKTGCAGKALREERDKCRDELQKTILRIGSHD